MTARMQLEALRFESHLIARLPARGTTSQVPAIERAGEPFEESGLERLLAEHGGESPAALAPAILRAVEAHARDSRFTDDLTVLILKRL